MKLSWPVLVVTTALLTLACVPARSVNAQCCADCNGDGGVTIDELVRGVSFSLLGCPDDLPPAVELRSIDPIVSTGSLQVVDVSSKGASVVFESSVPLVCSVVYGKTTAYGHISTDPDMRGAARTDHRVLLVGLKPDGEYRYRVQGIAPDGALYVGANLTFRTLPGDGQTGLNLALLDNGARVIAVSGNFGGTDNNGPWGADRAIDGNAQTAWASNGDGNDAFIEVELSAEAALHSVEVWTRSMSDGSARIFSFTLTTDRDEVLGPFSLPDAERGYDFAIDTVARTLRLDVVESSGGNTGLIEFAAYGTTGSDE